MEVNLIQSCTNLIQKTTNIVVLTGAGISTESGIKDFRSRTGIYTMAPEYILSLDYFFKQPREFYQFAVENLYHSGAEPNLGHQIVAKWEQEGKVKHIITQNIDGLHQKAGSENVIEFHGTMKTATCLNCGEQYSTEEMIEGMKTLEDFFICEHCEKRYEEDHYIKPDVVLFGDTGEWFSMAGFNTVLNIIHQADCLLVLGTSLKVTPFSSFPQNRADGTPMIIINKGETPYDLQPDTFVIRQSIGKTLSQINQNLY